MQEIRNKIWIEFVTTKFKTLYISNFNSRQRGIESIINIFTSIATSGSVAAWLIWEQIPYIWASIICVNTLVQLIRPHLPILKNQKELMDIYISSIELHFDYDKLWYEFARILTHNHVRLSQGLYSA